MSKNVRLDESEDDQMESNKVSIAHAAELLKQQKEREALAAFAEVYDQSQDENERKIVFERLIETFYAPNEEALRANYERNLEALKQYQYFWDKTFREYDQLPFRLFSISNKYFYLYSKEKDRFEGEYDAATDRQMRYFFENTDEPIKVENEDNFYNLNFLNDNVRASEDYAADNHIYLFYDTTEPLERLMMTCDLGPILQQKKFVFLIGEENKKRYPVDFKKEFGIDYTACQPKELSVNDIKRIVFGLKIAGASGTSFLADIMDFHPDLLTIPDCMMYSFADFYTRQLQGKTLTEAVSFWKQLSDDDPGKSDIMNLVSINSIPATISIKHVTESARKEFDRVTAEEFLTVLESVLAEFPRPNAKEWLIGLFLTYSRCHVRSFGRVIPALFLYPHDNTNYLTGDERDKVNFYFDLVASFPYHNVIAIIRNPVSQSGNIVSTMTSEWWPKARNSQGELDRVPFGDLTFFCLRPRDFYFPLQHPLRESFRVVRFEDLKLNPKATFASMGEFLNIPVTRSMFHTTWCGLTINGVDAGKKVYDGFDQAPVYESYDHYLSVFDKYRIELLLRNLMDAYGYQAKYYDGQRFSDEEIVKMMELPFLCDSFKTAVPPERNRFYHERGMQFIKFAISIKEFPFTVNDGTEQFAPVPWLLPKEELLEQSLFR